MSEEVEPLQSFEELFTQYFGRVDKFALTLTRDASQAEEITQNTFYKALKKIDSFQGRSEDVYKRQLQNRLHTFRYAPSIF